MTHMNFYVITAVVTPPILGAALLLADTAVAYHLPIEYYVATLSVLGMVVVILRSWSWVRGEMKSIVSEEFRTHLEVHRTIDAKLDSIITALHDLPCNRRGICDDREARPAVTPVGLPIVKPRKG